MHSDPHVLLQGTTTNGEYLLPFKSGAFLAGAPVQPVLIHYGKVCLPAGCGVSALPVVLEAAQIGRVCMLLLLKAVEVECALYCAGQSFSDMGKHRHQAAALSDVVQYALSDSI